MYSNLFSHYSYFIIFSELPSLQINTQLLTARRYASAGNSDRNMSVRLTVCHEPVLYQNEES